MARALMCDRCGKIFSYEGAEEEPTRYVLFDRNIARGEYRATFAGNYLGDQIDLCKDCSGELASWMGMWEPGEL